jgi:hypothetical protein
MDDYHLHCAHFTEKPSYIFPSEAHFFLWYLCTVRETRTIIIFYYMPQLLNTQRDTTLSLSAFNQWLTAALIT